MGDRSAVRLGVAVAVAISAAVGVVLGAVVRDHHDDPTPRWVIAEDVESVNPAGKMLRCTFAASLGDEPRLYITECHDPPTTPTTGAP